VINNVKHSLTHTHTHKGKIFQKLKLKDNSAHDKGRVT